MGGVIFTVPLAIPALEMGPEEKRLLLSLFKFQLLGWGETVCRSANYNGEF